MPRVCVRCHLHGTIHRTTGTRIAAMPGAVATQLQVTYARQIALVETSNFDMTKTRSQDYKICVPAHVCIMSFISGSRCWFLGYLASNDR
jgi:hypothetical protein